MAEKTPARLWLTAEEIGWPGSFRSFRLTDLEHPEEYPLYVRADSHDKLVDALKAAKVAIEMMERPSGIGPEVAAALDARCAKIDAALASLDQESGQ